MKKIIFMNLLAILFLSSFFAACKKKDLNVLKVGTNASFPPFEYIENGKIVGFDIDLMNKIGKKLNMKIVFEDMQFNTLLVALSTGKIDVVAAGLTVIPEREKQVSFTIPYFYSKQMIIVNIDDNSVNTVDDLKGKKVGVQLGTTSDIYISDMEGVTSVKFDSFPMAAMELKNKKIDAVMIDIEPAKKIVANNKNLKMLDIVILEENTALAVNKKNKDLLNKLNIILEEMKKNGEFDEMFSKYFINQ